MPDLTLDQLRKAYDAALEQLAAESFLLQGMAPQAYINALRSGNNPGDDPNADDLRGKLRMTLEQAQAFESRYGIIDAYQNDAMGFSAVALRDTDNPGRVVIAVRSTELNNDRTRDLGADVQIFTSGFAFDQILSAQDFLERVRPQLQPGEKIDLVGYSLSGNIVRTLAAMYPTEVSQTIGANVVFNATGLGGFTDPTGQNRPRDIVLQEMLSLYRQVEADPNSATDVPIHLSLLQLAAIAAAPLDRTDPTGNIYSAPRQDFAEAYIQNRYGTFYNDLGTTGPEASFTQYVGVALSGFDANAVANSGSHPVPVGIAIEGQPVVEIPGLAPRFDYLNTHSLTLIADSLRLQILFKEIDSSISTDAIQAIFQASSASAANTLLGRSEKDTLEHALDAVRKALLPLDPNFQPTPSSDVAGSFGNMANRTVFHNNITAVENVLPPQPSPYQIEVLVDRPLEDVKGNALLEDSAGKGLAYRYALTALNPFTIIGPTYNQHNPNGELELYNPVTGLGTMTTDYIQDRGLFLAAKVALNQANLDRPLNPFSLTYYHDNTTAYDIPSGLSIPPGVQREYMFGSDNPETISGGPLFANDHLYGGDGIDTLQGFGGDDYLQGDGGNDTLDGGSGADRMVGGQGNDTYLVDHAGDQVTEGLNNGSDTVHSSVSFTLGDNLEDLMLTGTEDLNGTGNDLDNQVTGNSGINRLEGKGGTDHLIGNGGNDVLIGGSGDEDLLEGGIGFDTYLYNVGDGMDRIEDSDADGVIKVNGQVLAGGIKQKGAPTWKSPDGTIEYVMAGTDLVVKLDGDQILIVNEDFQSGQFGIRLIDATALPDGTVPTINYQNGLPGQTFTGDDTDNVLGPLGGSGARFNVTAFGNGGDDWIVANSESSGNHQFFGGTGADLLEAAQGNDRLYGEAGRDLLFGDEGDDVLEGGDQEDFLAGGLGDDVLDGGTGDDSLTGGSGDDVLRGGLGVDLLAGDAYDVPVADMGADYLHGGAGNDWLFGLLGNDVLVGGTEDDHLYGDTLPADSPSFNYEWPGQITPLAAIPFTSVTGGADYLDGEEGSDYLQGDAEDDILLGGAGNDELVGDDLQVGVIEEGDDWLDGQDGDDVLVGGGGEDALFGGDGKDLLIGDYATTSTLGFADILDGGAGNDDLQGGGGDDLLDGGSEDDRVFGEGGNDHLYGGAGDDQLQGGNGNDMLFGEEGMDLLSGHDGDDLLFGDDGDDRLSGGGGVDQLVGGSGDDLLQGEDGNDTVFGDEGNDELHGGDGHDTLLGGAGADVLFGEVGNDTLWGDDGDDQLVGDAGNDALDGGTGNDVVSGGVGLDTYVIGRGDGIDTIVDTAGEGNRVVFEDLTRDDITVELAPNALVIQVGAGGQQVSIAGFRSGNALAPSAIDEYQFADGTLLTHTDMVARGMGIPTQVFTSGVITGVVNAGGSGEDSLAGTGLNDYLFGAAGDDVLDGGDGDDVFLGGAGNDWLNGGAGDDQYTFAVGDGMDTIEDLAGSSAGNRVVFEAGIVSADLTLGWHVSPFGFGPDRLLIRVGMSGDALLLTPFDRTDVLGAHAVDSYQFADGTTLSHSQLIARGVDFTGTDGNDLLAGTNVVDRLNGLGGADVLQGGDGNDVLDGGAGNDLLNGGRGDDTYRLGRGTGQDRLIDQGGTNDTIQYASGVTPSDIAVTKTGKDIVLTIADTGDAVILSQFFTASVLQIDAVRFADGTVWDAAMIAGFAERTIVGTAGGETLTGTVGDDTLQGLAGDDQLNGLAGNDLLDGGVGADIMSGGLGDDTYVVDDAADTIIEAVSQGLDGIQSSVTYTLSANVEQLTLTGTGAINGTGNILNNVLIGNSAANALVGGAGHDTYAIGIEDTVVERADEGTDTVQIAQTYMLGANLENLTLTGSSPIDGTGNDLDNVLTGNSAVNVLTGGKGNDTYVVSAGDIVVELAGDGIDTVQTVRSYRLGANVENLTLLETARRNIPDVQWGPGAFSAVQTSIYGGTPAGVQVGIGNELDNVLVGNDQENILEGGIGNDTLAGNAGRDLLRGGVGQDTYLFGFGSDTDVIDDVVVGEVDTIQLGSGITPDQLTLERGSLSDSEASRAGLPFGLFTLGLNLPSQDSANPFGSDHLLITYSSLSELSTKQVRFADGTEWDAQTLLDKSAGELDPGLGIMLDGGSDDDLLIGTAANDRVNGSAGNDRIEGGAGHDVLDGGEGNDVMFGGDGRDTIAGGAGDNELDGGAGNDTISAMGWQNVFRGGAGDDRLDGQGLTNLLDGGIGNDALIGGGVDTFVFGRGYGRDTANPGPEDTIIMNPDVLPADVRLYTFESANHRLGIQGTTDELQLGDSFPGQIVFADGTVWSHAYLISHEQQGVGTDLNDAFFSLYGPGPFFGRNGDDYYDVIAGDNVIELSNEGTDSVRTNSDYTLPDHVENLLLGLNSPALLGIGNDLDNVIIGAPEQGHGGDNILDGGAGNDVLIGGASIPSFSESGDGNDILIGGPGNDVLRPFFWMSGGPAFSSVGSHGVDLLLGGPGDDTYIMIGGFAVPSSVEPGQQNILFDLPNATLTELPGEGSDTVVVISDHTLEANVETLFMFGGTRGVGNELDNVLVGSDGANWLEGGAGNDTLIGGYGRNDGSSAGTAGLLDDSVDDGASDTMIGGIGNDVYVVGVGDVIVEQTDEGIDTVVSRSSVVLGENLEWVRLAGDGSIDATGNALDNVLVGNSAANMLVGAGGNDVLRGGLGDDTYVFNLGDGTDTLDDVLAAGAGNRIQFGPGITQADLAFVQDHTARTLTIQVGGSGTDKLILTNFDSTGLNGSLVARTFAFADTTTVNLADLFGAPVNHAPTVANPLVDQTVLEDTPFSIQIPANTFADHDVGDTLIYRAALQNGTALPSWLSFDLTTRMFTGTPDDAQVGTLNLNVTVTDTGGLSASSSVVLTVQNVNEAPMVANPLADQQVTEGTAFTFVVPTNTFADPDAGDTLTYRATQLDGTELPSWLSFDPLTHTFSGTPQGLDIGTLDVRVTATDTGALSASDVFALTILPIMGTAGSDTLTGTASDDVILGLAGDDTLQGVAGNDLLDGGPGIDSMAGGLGNDTYVVDVAGDVVTEVLNQGTDTVQSGITYALGANVENLVLTGTAVVNGSGNSLNNSLTGNSANNTLNGGGGDDTMAGGQGHDTYVVENVGDMVTELTDEGTDLVQSAITYTLGANLENLTLTGSAAIKGTGNMVDNTLTGNSAANVLTGGAGNDTYVVGTGDTVVEQADEGVDTVQTAVTWALGANLENLMLTGVGTINGTGNSLNNVFTGNSAPNTLDAGGGDDTLNGGAGADTLIGGTGNDIYVVDNIGDVVTEQLDEGIDLVRSSVSYTLGANVESLTLTGTGAIRGGGNTLDNILTGNSGANVLDGGTGADVLIGGLGNDTYVVDNFDDVVIENINEGTDTVQSRVTYALATNIENLTLTGTAAITATGNRLNNTLTGNSGNNVLDGGGGTDTLRGGLGDDTYILDDATDVVTENVNEGADTIQTDLTYTLGANVENLLLTGGNAVNGTGNGLNNLLAGNLAANTLTGGAGADTLIGGQGDDTYVVDNVGDVVTEEFDEGIDLVQSSVTYALSTNVENLTLTGTAAINAMGNTLNNRLIGNSGSNVLDGGVGADTLIGGAGNDTYVVDDVGDVVTEAAAQGIDTVQSAMTYVLGTDLENLTLTGGTASDGTGNSLPNILTGNSASNTLTGLDGNDTLDGGAGADTLVGGFGNDTYVVESIGDVVTENLNEGTDLVQSSVSYALTAHVENLTLTGPMAINGVGNALNNRLTGNSGANQLAGGAGNDTYVVSTGDTIVERAGEGIDTVQSDVNWTLGANLENLTLTGTAAIDATGNTFNNTLTGNTAANQLVGGVGNDTLRGGLGNDIYLIGRGEGQDVIVDIDSTSGNSDRLQYGVTIHPLDLVLSRQVNDLRLAVHGSADQVTIRDWYLSTNNQIETVQAGSGSLLLSTQVDQLVQAMASFSQQSGLTWDQAIDQRPQDVQTILAASWQ